MPENGIVEETLQTLFQSVSLVLCFSNEHPDPHPIERRMASSREVCYKLLDHVADLGVEVSGQSLEGLFVESARALFDLLGTLEATEITTEKKIRIEADDREDLLRAWLSELLFLSTTRGMVFSRFRILSLDSHKLEALAMGEPYDPARHSFEREIKAVTFHGLEIVSDRRGWKASVIFDV